MPVYFPMGGFNCDVGVDSDYGYASIEDGVTPLELNLGRRFDPPPLPLTRINLETLHEIHDTARGRTPDLDPRGKPWPIE